MFKDYSKYPGIIIGTGPSLSEKQIEYIKRVRSWDGCRVFCGNNAYTIIDPDVIFSNNPSWWRYFWREDPRLQGLKCDKWTWDEQTAKQFKIKYIPGKWADSLSTDPSYIHYGHGTGYEILGIAYHYGIRKFILVGYDLKYPKDYNGKKKEPGGLRHSKLILPTGEYPAPLQHWTQSPNSIDKEGRLIGLIRLYEKIDCTKLEIEIINCSPGSALTCYPIKKLEEVL